MPSLSFAVRLFLSLSMLLAMVSRAEATTDVSGNITTETRWTLDGSPYIVHGLVVIRDGARLQVDAGVTVYMAAGSGLTVQAGTLRINGSAAQPVEVLSDQVRLGQTAAAGDWSNWRFDAGCVDTRLEHVRFRHGSGLIVEGSAPQFNHLDIQQQKGPAIRIDLVASPTGVGNQASGNQVNGIVVPAGEVAGTVRWGLRGIPYIVERGELSVGKAPVFQRIEPAIVEQGQTVTLRVIGQRLEGVPKASFSRSGLTATSSGSGSGSQTSLQLNVAANAPLGATDLRLLVDAGELRIAKALTVAQPTPVINAIEPTTVLAGAGPTELIVRGRNFTAVSEVLVNAAALTTRFVNAAELRATLPVQTAIGSLQVQVRSPDVVQSGQYLLSGSSPLTIQAPVPPTIAVEPTPIALPPDAKPHNVTVRLSKPDYRDNTLSLSISDTTKVTLVPSSVFIPAGQTTAQLTLTPVQTGTVSLTIDSTNLARVSVPVFITADFRGANTAYSDRVGIVVESEATPVTTTHAVSGGPVGITVGSAVTGVFPKAWPVGTNQRLDVTGVSIPPNASVKLTPAEGVTIGEIVVGESGQNLQALIETSVDATRGARRLTITDAAGNEIPLADPALAQIQMVAGLPTIDSIAPNFATPGTVLNLTIRGRNLQQGTVRVQPAAGIIVESSPAVSADGTSLTVKLDISAQATTGARLIQVAGPAGDSSGSFSAANTLNIVSSVGNAVTPVSSPIVGIVVGENVPEPVTRIYAETSKQVGVVVGSGIANVQPRTGVVGTEATVVVTGTGLQGADSASFLPADGLTIGPIEADPDGTRVQFSVTVDPAAVLGQRRLTLKAGDQPLPFNRGELGAFLISAPVPELESVAPNVLLAGNPSLRVSLRGRNLLNVSGVRVEPADGITVSGPYDTAADGRSLGFSMTVAAGAASGTRTVIVTTSAGDSTPVNLPGNSVRIAAQLGPTYAAISSPVVGVKLESPVVEPERVISTIASLPVGIVVEKTAEPTTYNGTVASPQVGLIVGSAAATQTPDGWLQGASGVISIAGYELGRVTSAVLTPASGVTLDIPSSNELGDALTLPIQVAPDAPPVSRKLRLFDAQGLEILFADGRQSVVGIGSLPTITSVAPIFAEQGKALNLSFRGSNLKGVSGIAFEPASGVVGSGPITWSSDSLGELLTVSIRVAADAPTGARVARLQVPGGATAAVASPANTVTVVPPQ